MSESDSAVQEQSRFEIETLFREHSAFLAAFVHRLGIAQGDVDDVVQEVFVIAFKKGGYIPGRAAPRTWLAAIAVRVAANARRARARRREHGDAIAMSRVEAKDLNPALAAESTEALARVRASLEELDLDHRVVFVLYEIEGNSCGDIATALEIPVGTVYSRLHHARERFLKIYKAADSIAPTTSRYSAGRI